MNNKFKEILAEAGAGLEYSSEVSGEQFSFHTTEERGKIRVVEYTDEGEVLSEYVLRLTVEE